MLIKIADVPLSENIFFLRSAVIENRLEKLPQLKSAHLKKRLPGTVVLQVEERKPFAVLVSDKESLIIDEEGYILGGPKDKLASDINITSLPVITGLEKGAQSESETKISRSYMEVIENYLKFVSPFFETRRLQLDVMRKDNLVLRADDILCVYLGNEENIGDKISVLKLLLPQITGKWNSLEYIDLRIIDNPVIKFKEY